MLLHSARLTLLWMAMLQGAVSLAQVRAQPTAPATPVATLLARAMQLDAAGKSDLAAQAWRQVLLADPSNASAMEGLARFYERHGDAGHARKMLQRLRASRPDDPMLPALENGIADEAAVAKPSSFPATQDARLLRAEQTSQEGDRAEAFRIFRSVFAGHPPKQWAVAYYEAEAAVPGQSSQAIAGLQRTAQQFPDDAALGIALGRMLTLNPASRLRGTEILARYASSRPTADRALRQALLWGAASPAMAGQVSAYLQAHSDPQLAAAFARARSAQRNNSRKTAGYLALHDKNLPIAEQDFRSVLARHPNDASALAGMGFASLQQRNFSAATRWLELAKRHGARDEGLQKALTTARFWQHMGAYKADLTAQRLQDAEREVKAALAIQPENPEAVLAFAHLLAIAGHTSQSEETLSRALQAGVLPLTPQQRAQMLLQYAALCVEDRHYRRARTAYGEVRMQPLADEAAHISAWQGLVLIEHLRSNDAAGLQLWQQMHAAMRTASMRDVSFVLLLAGMRQSQGDPIAARALLLQARNELQSAGAQSPLDLLRQLAAVDVALQQPKAAIPLYRAVLARGPLDVAAWTDLLLALHQAGENKQAQATDLTMPEAVRSRLLHDPTCFRASTMSYFQTMASVEQTLGNPQAALDRLKQLDSIAHSFHAEVPVDLQLQQAWLEYDLHRDDAAQGTLLRLQKYLAAGQQTNANQQEQMAELAANLAVRSATRLTAQDDRQDAVRRLDAASSVVGNRSIPRTRLAVGYLTAGQPATAVAIYQSVDMQAATVGDVRAAVGAAMESKRMNLAQRWLQQGLADHPHDAGLLLLAGKFAESNGDGPLAQKYLRAALSPTHTAQTAGIAPNEAVRRQAADLLASIRAAHSGWFGGTGYLNHITGTSGTTQLSDVEVPVEASTPIGERARLTAVARAVHLDAGGFHGAAGQALGTLKSGTPAPAAPVAGVGGSLQFATRSVAASIGSTPAGFPVLNVTAAALLHRPRNPWTLAFSRDSVRESQLSYAGLHDPARPANVWGGVVANMGSVQYARGNAQSGWYATASGGVVTGKHVASNTQITGDAGAYRQIWARRSPGAAKSLRIGINFYAQHNAHNELFFTYGHGGYFSPQYYLLPAVPLTWAGSSGARTHYEFSGSLGPQILQQASAAYFPLDPTLQTAPPNLVYPSQFSLGVNYGVQGKISWLRGEHWLFGGFFSVNNAYNYNQQIGGFSLRYLFRAQHVSKNHAAGWFPYSGLRPYKVP
ncbi:MAG: cellulose synthase subunit BcsC-related outer membrane protein [Acidobacteriaceae bacterium]